MNKKELKQLIREELESVIGEGRSPRAIGKYNSMGGGSYWKFKDDENYTSIKVNGQYITIDFNGEQENPSRKEIQDKIDAIRNQPPPMDDNEFRRKMMKISGRF